MRSCLASIHAGFMAVAVSACTVQRWQPAQSPSLDDHARHAGISLPAMSLGLRTGAARQGIAGIPAGNADAAARLQASPRKSEYAKVAFSPGSKDSVMLWISYPQTRTKAPVVVVIHDNQGLSTWVRGVADQLAADGFIAIAPDLLSRVRGVAASAELPGDSVRKIIGGVTRDDKNLGVLAAATYGMSLPAAEKRYAVVGYCWGGGASFDHAVFSEKLGAAVVYYGTPPAKDSLAKITAPVLGLYGGTDARIGATVPGTDSAMKAFGKAYEPHSFEGAGHGFLRSQGTAPDVEASRQAWPLTIAFLRKNLGVK